MSKYEVIQVEPNSWTIDAEGSQHRALGRTLARASTWRELMKKEDHEWYVGAGAVILRDGKEIGTSTDILEAQVRRYDPYNGWQLPVRLRDFLNAVEDNKGAGF